MLGAGVSIALVGGLVWLVLPKDSQPPASTVAVLEEPVPSFTNRQADAQRDSKPEKPYDGPPRFTVQLLDTDEHTCPATFTESIVVPVVEGDVRSIEAVVRVPYDKVVRTRALNLFNGEWSTIIGGLPTKRTVKLLLIAQGEGGKTTVAEDITHICPGKPVDKPDPRDLGTKLARQKMRKNMFNFDFKYTPDARRDREDSEDRDR